MNTHYFLCGLVLISTHAMFGMPDKEKAEKARQYINAALTQIDVPPSLTPPYIQAGCDYAVRLAVFSDLSDNPEDHRRYLTLALDRQREKQQEDIQKFLTVIAKALGSHSL